MSAETAAIPRFTIAEAHAIVRQNFDLDGTLSVLPSYCDQNFRLETPDGRSEELV